MVSIGKIYKKWLLTISHFGFNKCVYLKLIFLVLTSILFLDTMVIAQPFSLCDTIGLQQLHNSIQNYAAPNQKQQLAELMKNRTASGEPLLEFTLCPNQNKEYTSEELIKLTAIGIEYFNYSRIQKAKEILNVVLDHIPPNNYYPHLADVHNFLGIIANVEEDWITAYFHFKQLLKWENENRKEINVSGYMNLGSVYNALEDFEEANYYFEIALKLSNGNTLEHGWLLFHLGRLASFNNNFPKAEQYLHSASQIWELKNDRNGACFTAMELGRIYGKTKSKAFTIDYIEEILSESDFIPKKCKASLLLYLIELNLDQEKVSKALKKMPLCEQLILDPEEDYPVLKIHLYEQKLRMAFLNKDTDKAMPLLDKFNGLYLSFIKSLRLNANSSLNRLKQLTEKEKEINTLLLQEKHTAAQLKSQKLISIFATSLLLMATILAGKFYLSFQRKKKGNETLLQLNQEITQQKEALYLASEKIKEQKKELEYQLVNKAIAISKYGEVMDNLEKMAQSKDFNIKKEIIFRKLGQLNSHEIKEDLNLQINNTNQEFFQILATKFPRLSQNELRLCAFLKLNLTTKEIANLTFKTPESVKVARSRLRKKLGLTHQKIAVSVFLNQL